MKTVSSDRIRIEITDKEDIEEMQAVAYKHIQFAL